MSIKKNKILLLCETFPPDLGVGGRRWQRFTDALGDKYEFTVIAGTYDSNYEGKQSNMVHRVAIPKLRLDRFVGTFGSAPRKEEEVNTSKPAKVRTGGSWREKMSGVFEWLRVIRSLIPLVDLNRWYASNLCHYIDNYWGKGDFDIIVATLPSAGNVMAGKVLAKKWNCPWIADFRDPWAEDYHAPFAKGSFLDNCLKNLEARTIRSAHKVIVINKEMMPLVSCSASQLEVVHNGMVTYPEIHGKNVKPDKNGAIVLGYVGGVMDKSDYILFAKGAAEHNLDWVEWRHWGPMGSDSYLTNQLSESEVKYNHMGNLPLDDMLEGLALCDYLVLFGNYGKSSKCIQRGKIFDYLRSGKPILMIGGVQDSAMYSLLSKGAVGYWLKDEEDVVEFFVNRQMPNSNREFRGSISELKEYHIDQTSQKIDSIFEQILGNE